jgi:HD-GYP domain-containing protein (c-di-GMP phosphodiesterase class II)
MRYVPISCIKEGMVIAKNLYNNNNKLLIRKGSHIKDSYILRMKNIGYQGVYIEDDISSELEIKDLVSDELRRKTVYTVKDVFESLEVSKKSAPLGTPNKSGEIDVTSKPISADVSSGIESTKKLVDDLLYDVISNKEAVINMIDIKFFDEYTFYHCVNVAILSMAIGVEMNLPTKKLHELGLAAVLHDIGKIHIEKGILLKQGKLTDDEYEQVKQHSELGYKHLKNTYEIPMASYVGVLQHHERYDGTGYPFQKAKDEISLYGRIICIADVYDAITSNRPYRKAMLPSEAMEYIMANSGSMFDSEIVEIFIKKIAAYPVGMSVKLSNNMEALVVNNNVGAPLRPIVKVHIENNQNEDYFKILDLSDMTKYKNITIVDIVQ